MSKLVVLLCAQAAYNRHADDSKDPGRMGCAVRAFHGFACSNRDAIFFNGWNSNDDASDAANGRQNKIARFRAGLDNLLQHLTDVTIEHMDIFDRPTPTNTLVYAGTIGLAVACM
jgi:hypothetical protein